MLYGVIDIGSNSVRLLLWADGKTICKKIATTRLGAGVEQSGALSSAAIARTARAVASYYEEAKAQGAAAVYVFATAAVRSASSQAFMSRFMAKLLSRQADALQMETAASAAEAASAV